MSVVYTDDDYLIVNLLILISMVLFEIGYAFGLRIKRREKVKYYFRISNDEPS